MFECSQPIFLKPGNPSFEAEEPIYTAEGDILTDVTPERADFLFAHMRTTELGIVYSDEKCGLPILVHPVLPGTPDYADTHLGEICVLIRDASENAAIYLGFREEVTEEEKRELILGSGTDSAPLKAKMNRVPVTEGNVFYVHTGELIGGSENCVAVVIHRKNEPLLRILPGVYEGGLLLTGNLTMDEAVSGISGKAVGAPEKFPYTRNLFTMTGEPGFEKQAVLGVASSFTMNLFRYKIRGKEGILADRGVLYFVLRGEGTLALGPKKWPVKKGDMFFLPYVATGVFASGDMDLYYATSGKPFLARK